MRDPGQRAVSWNQPPADISPPPGIAHQVRGRSPTGGMRRGPQAHRRLWAGTRQALPQSLQLRPGAKPDRSQSRRATISTSNADHRLPAGVPSNHLPDSTFSPLRARPTLVPLQLLRQRAQYRFLTHRQRTETAEPSHPTRPPRYRGKRSSSTSKGTLPLCASAGCWPSPRLMPGARSEAPTAHCAGGSGAVVQSPPGPAPLPLQGTRRPTLLLA